MIMPKKLFHLPLNLPLITAVLTSWVLANTTVTAAQETHGAVGNSTAPHETLRYHGEKISISADSLELSDFFRLIAEVSKLNVVVHPAVHGKITLQLKDVPWDHVLALVTQQKLLVSVREGSVLYIIPASQAAAFFGG